MAVTDKKYKGARRCAALLLAALTLILCVLLCRRVLSDMAQQQSDSVRQAVLQCAVQCYAVEGAYPPSLSYMEDNYGLVINEERYIVIYDAFASNLLPQVAVLPR